jgi:hypothetical protein
LAVLYIPVLAAALISPPHELRQCDRTDENGDFVYLAVDLAIGTQVMSIHFDQRGASALAAIDNQFLVPVAGEKELIVITDSQGSASFLIAKADTIVLSSPATDLLKKAYLTPTPPQLKNVAGTAIQDQAVVDWFTQSAAANVFTLTSTAPTVTRETTRRILAGQAISNTTFNGSKITVQNPGNLRTRSVNGVTLNWYISDQVLSSPILGFVGSAGLPRGRPGDSLIPKPAGGPGANCSDCAICSVCGGCSFCVLCGPSAAGVVGVVGVDTVIGVTAASGSAAAFQALRQDDDS